MPAITAIFGGDARPLEAEVARAQAIITRFQAQKGSALVGVAPDAAVQEAANLSRFRALEQERQNTALRTERIIEGATTAASIAQMGSIEAVQRADAAATAKRIADIEILRLAAIKGGVQSSVFGHGLSGAGGGGGVSGVIRESFVLIREALRGNWSRMVGSLTLMAQYTGTLGKVLKSSAAEAIAFAKAQNLEYASTARAAVAAEAKAVATMQAAEAATFDSVALNAEAEAAEADALALRTAALAQQAKAAAAVEAAEMQAAAATLSLGPIGWAIAATLALVVGIIAWYKIAKTVRDENNRLSLELGFTNSTVLDQARAFREARKEAENYAKAVREAHDASRTLTEQSELDVTAINDKYDSTKTLNSAQDEQKKSEIDLQQQQGHLTKEQAINAKAQIDADALTRNSTEEGNRLAEISASKKAAAATAQSQLDTATKKSNEVEARSNNAKDKARMASLQEVVNKGVQSPWYNKYQLGTLTGGTTSYDADVAAYESAKAELEGLQRLQGNRDEKAQAAQADMTKAGEQNRQLQKEAGEAAQKNADFQKNNPAVLKAKEATLEAQKQKELAEQENKLRGGGFGLTGQQKVGAYAATPSDWSSVVFNIKGIHENTKGFRNPSAGPVHSAPASFGGHHGFVNYRLFPNGR